MNDEKKDLIMDYITEDECCNMCDKELYDCVSCSSLEDCYMNSCVRCNSEYVESIDYGGYNNEEEFLEQLMD